MGGPIEKTSTPLESARSALPTSNWTLCDCSANSPSHSPRKNTLQFQVASSISYRKSDHTAMCAVHSSIEPTEKKFSKNFSTNPNFHFSPLGEISKFPLHSFVAPTRARLLLKFHRAAFNNNKVIKT